jgi:hypothetical protein
MNSLVEISVPLVSIIIDQTGMFLGSLSGTEVIKFNSSCHLIRPPN